MLLQAIFSIGAQAVALATHVEPILNRGSLTEGYVSQPMIMAHASVLRNRLSLGVMANFGGLTLARGELNPGVYGEGYADRRHPHTYLHELVGTVVVIRDAVSLTAGKGFVPFGTDDPMSRPLVKYPANHHLAQILERAIVIGHVRWRAFQLDGALLNGDEPTAPDDSPDLNNFGDSFAARLTYVRGSVEAQASHALLNSPENIFGVGLDHRKESISVRYADAGRAWRPYALAEWAVSDELRDGVQTFRFWSTLAEGALTAGGTRLAARLEVTLRPEEERELDVFRTRRPLSDNGILGITRWSLATLHASREMRMGPLRLGPFVEVTFGDVTATARPAAFDPATEVFGSRTVSSLSGGVRLSVGTIHERMGRYGSAARHSH